MTDKKTEALKLALEALEGHTSILGLEDREIDSKAITAIREALAGQCICGEPDTPGTHRTDGPCFAEQPAQQDIPKIGCVNHDCDKCKAQQQELVAWMWKDGTITSDPDRADGTWMPLYTTPPASKPFVGLTDEERNWLRKRNQKHDDYAKAVEALLKEKNQ